MYIKSLEQFISSNGNKGKNGYEDTNLIIKWWRNKAVESAKEQLELYKVGKGRLQENN